MITSLSCDLFIRLKNASKTGKKSIVAPLSKNSLAILAKIKKAGFLNDFSIDKENKLINIISPSLTDVEIISRPGRHLFCKSSQIPWGKTPNSLIIISTSKGLLTQKEAAFQKIGGELLAEIY
jgi:small subunit ribosomal protein S8